MNDCVYGATLLKIQDVCLQYGDKQILRNVNAEVKEIQRTLSKGQVVGFLGPSGRGKTQLFRIIAGLNKPTSGIVTLNGTAEPVHPGEVGVVAQDYPLFEHRTVMSNLMLAALRKEKSEQAAKDRVSEHLAEFDLTDKAHLYPAQLSGGQRQRVAVMQQLLCSDHFILMDEPFSGLDIINKQKVCELISRVANRDALNTVIVTTHDVATACAIADHLWLLGIERDASGQIIPGSSIQKIYDLVARDLCWHGDIKDRPEFRSFVHEVEQEFVRL